MPLWSRWVVRDAWLQAVIAALIFSLLSVFPALAEPTGVFTYHNDNARTGANLSETILTPKNVSRVGFGKLFSRRVDGDVYAQPLYAKGVAIPGFAMPQQVVYVATEHDSVYAFDATGARRAPFWHVNFLDRRHHVTTVSWQDVGTKDIVPEIGITGTPVIDPSTGELYVVAATREGTTFVQRLHALDLSTGQEKVGGPIVISASAMGTGIGSDASGMIAFNARTESQRPALLLDKGVVYIAWASHGDLGPYHGWVIAYDAATFAQLGVWNTSPNGNDAGIWMSGSGIATDPTGNLFLATGNGTFDADTGGADYGDSFVKLAPGAGLGPLDFCTPSDAATRNEGDLDLGSGGVLLLPDQSVGPLHLMVEGAKRAKIYVVNRDAMGGLSADDSQMQVVSGAITNDELGTPAYFNSTLYFGAVNDNLKAFALNDGVLSSSPVSLSGSIFGYPGSTPSASANGSTNGIIWSIQQTGTSIAADGAVLVHGRAILRAFDASNLDNELYNSNQAGRRDLLNVGVKFTVPTVADGRVFVGTVKRLTVFGLLRRPRETSSLKGLQMAE